MQLRTMSVIVPDRIKVKLTAVAFQSYAFATIDDTGTYAGNGLADPFLGNSDLQAPGFLQWMAFYEKYRVIHSKIFIQFINDGISALNRAIWLSVYPSRNAGTPLPSGYLTGAAQPYAKRKFVGAITGMDKATISNQIGTSKIIGVNCNYENDFSGQVDTNPVSLWYWQLSATGLPDSTNFPVMTFMISITYTAIFYNRKPIDNSTFQS